MQMIFEQHYSWRLGPTLKVGDVTLTPVEMVGHGPVSDDWENLFTASLEPVALIVVAQGRPPVAFDMTGEPVTLDAIIEAAPRLAGAIGEITKRDGPPNLSG